MGGKEERSEDPPIPLKLKVGNGDLPPENPYTDPVLLTDPALLYATHDYKDFEPTW